MHVHIIYLWLKFPLNLDPWVTSCGSSVVCIQHSGYVGCLRQEYCSVDARRIPNIRMIVFVINYSTGLNIVTYWVSLVVLHMRSNNVNVAATIDSASCYISVVTRQ
jgi:hypothetical protein